MYWQASQFMALLRWRVMERERQNKVRKETQKKEKEKRGEKRTKGGEELRRWLRRDREGWRENVSCGQSIIQKRKSCCIPGAALNMPAMASPANGPQIDMRPDSPHPLIPSPSSSFSPPIRALISPLWQNV